MQNVSLQIYGVCFVAIQGSSYSEDRAYEDFLYLSLRSKMISLQRIIIVSFFLDDSEEY